MYCGNCGKEIDNDSRFCGYCGSPVSVESNMEDNHAKEDEPSRFEKEEGTTSKKGLAEILKDVCRKLKECFSPAKRKKAIIILAGAIVLVAAIISAISYSRPAAVAERYCKAFFSNQWTADRLCAYDAKIYNIYPCIDEESFFEKASDEYDADIHSWRDYYKEKNIYLQEELEDAYGVYQITTEATRVKNISINKLLDEEWEWINTLEGMNAFDSDTISAAKVVTVKCKVKGEDEVERTTLDVFVVKTGAMWKVLDFE